MRECGLYTAVADSVPRHVSMHSCAYLVHSLQNECEGWKNGKISAPSRERAKYRPIIFGKKKRGKSKREKMCKRSKCEKEEVERKGRKDERSKY